MSNNGAIHSAISDINNIRNNLLEGQGQEQQTGLMFLLKEIVQNADDCKAERLGIGWSDGIPDATHPLLHGPAIVAVNSGHFSKRDARGIRAIGLSTKENDSSAVGKFGQGLKTVFLICEAFFYLTGPDIDPGVEPGYILNLWSTDDEDDVPPSNWDNLPFEPVDQALVADERSRMGLEDGFTLWIPLRLESHCIRGNFTESDPEPIAIIPRYFDDGQDPIIQEFQSVLADEVAELLPLLKHVKQVQVFNQHGLRQIQLVEGSEQCMANFEQMSHIRQSLNGAIDICASPADISVVRPDSNCISVFHDYKGFQQCINQPHLDALKKQRDWPTTIPARADAYKPEPQKAEPHCAVVLHARPAAVQTSRLSIRWAVFLPTAEMPDGKPIETYTLDAVDQPEEYVITLHGFFFLQSDRRRIRDWSSDNSRKGVLQTWNQILAEQGTLRLLLPTLDAFARERSPQSVKVLTEALRSSELYKTYRQHICDEGAWLCTLNFNEQPSQLQWHFEKTTTAQNLLSIPESTFERLPEIFPTLAEVCHDHIVTFKEWPRLESSDYRPQSWFPDDIGSLLQGVTQLKAVEICADSDTLEVLCTFLTHALLGQQINIPAVSQPLTELLRSAFAVESFQPADNLKGLIDKLPSQLILGLPKSLPKTLSNQLFQLTTECLILPGDLTHSADLPDFSEYDAYQLLKTLVPEAANVKAVEMFAIKIFNQVQPHSSEIWQKICQLQLFRVSEIGNDENSQQFQSFNWLNQRRLEKRILSSHDRVALSRSLAAALQEKIYFLHESEKSRHLEILACSNQAILELFAIKPVPTLKTNPQTRTSLLREMLKVDISKSKYRQVSRYLLHGASEQFENLEDFLYESESLSGGPIWASALKLIIGRNQSWRFVDKALLKIVGSGSEQSDALKIGVVDHVGVTKDLRKLEDHEGSIAKLDWTSFSSDKREELIFCLPNDLLKQLCIHEPLNWQPGHPLVAIDENTYLAPSDKDFPICLELAKVLGVTLLRRCDRSQDIAQKQEQISSPIGAKDVVERILKRSDRAKYWRHVMDAVGHNPDQVLAAENLHRKSWLPLEGMQSSRALEDIIHLPIKEIQNELERICTNSGTTYITSNQLAKQLQDHKAFEVLREKLFRPRQKALEMIAEMLIEDSQYYVGCLGSFINTEETLTTWLDSFSQLSHVMPSWQILKAVHTKEALTLFVILAEPIESPSRLQTILNLLAGQHQANSRNHKLRRSLLGTYSQYLRLVQQLSEPHRLDVIRNIKLLSQTGIWKMADQLCIGESIDPQYVLNEILQDIIIVSSENYSFIDDAPPDSENKASFRSSEENYKTIRNYFESWPHRTRKAIGILLRILSGESQYLQGLASQYLEDVDRYLECLSLKGRNESFFRNKTRIVNFNIILNHYSQREVKSLAGKPLIVQIMQNLDSLIVGRHERVSKNKYTITFQVAPIDNSDHLIEILKNTFQYIVENIYEYKIVDFDDFWRKVNLSGVDIRVARHLLLDSGILSLRSQIKISEEVNPQIIKLIQEYSELQKRKAKLEVLGTAQVAIEDINKKLVGTKDTPGIRDRIGNLLCNDPQTQKIFLDAVKQKIKNASYDKESILFELFQNADDACCELRSIGVDNVPQEIRIGYNQNTEELWISHRGRRINQDCYSDQVFRDRGYDDDLIKMLLLNFSDKAEGVTGKFGLGFKSVFLATDRPKVVSGTLGLEVIGAVYPRELTREEFDVINECYLDGNADEGTSVVLPEVNLSVARDVLSVFEDKAPYLMAFSHWIKTITISGANGEMSYEWCEKRIKGLDNLNIYYGSGESYESSISALLLGDATRRCLLGLSSSGFTSLPTPCPTFWVTTPTRMFLDVGIAVNASFHPDIGRSQLDLSGGGYTHNKTLAQELGQEFGQALVQLFQADHEVILNALRLNSDLQLLDLWTSLWDILAKNLASHPSNDKGIDLIRTIFWSERCGLRHLYQECAALPTGIVVNGFNCLTRIGAIRWSLGGILSQHPTALTEVLKWPAFQEETCQIFPGQIIGQENAEILESFGYPLFQRITLLKFLKQQLNGHRVSVDSCHQIGQLISQKFVTSLEDREKTDIEQFLQTLHFEAQSGEWRLAVDLVVPGNNFLNAEEDMLVRITPNSHRLKQDYELGTLNLFHACKGSGNICSEVIEEWISEILLDVNNTEKHKYCIQYLVSSINRDEIIGRLKLSKNISGNTLAHIIQKQNSSQENYGVSIYSFQDLFSRLGLSNVLQSPTTEKNLSPTSPLVSTKADVDEPPLTADILSRILQWWHDNRKQLISKYESKLYPDGSPAITQSNYHLESRSITHGWLTLFILGVCHTMGRTHPEQHRDFLIRIRDWGWMDTMASGQINPNDWAKLLDSYYLKFQVGNRLEYYQWVRHYPALYAFSKWWSIYKESLLAVNSQRSSLRLDSSHISTPIDLILNPQQNLIFQGSGFGNGAPPIGSILGIGALFVIRELMRANILTNPGMRVYAYVPVRRVRAMLFAIGCQNVRAGGNATAPDNSKYIHDFLVQHLGADDATFNGDYDLPFLMLQQEPRDVQESILGTTPVPEEPSDSEGDISNWI